MQPRLGALDGDLPPARRGAGGARRRPAAGLPERRRLPDHGDRDRARAHPDPVPGASATTATGGPDTWWPTPEPPHRINQTLPRADPLRARRRHAGPRRAEPHQGDRASSRTTAASSRRPTTSTPANGSRSPAPTSSAATAADRGSAGGSARRCDGDAGRAARAVDRTSARPRLLALLRGKPAWVNFSLNPRRSGNMYAIDGRETWLIHNYLTPARDRLRRRRPRRLHPPDPRRRARLRVRDDRHRGLDRPPAGGRPLPRPARRSSAATRRTSGCRWPATA